MRIFKRQEGWNYLWLYVCHLDDGSLLGVGNDLEFYATNLASTSSMEWTSFFYRELHPDHPDYKMIRMLLL